MPTDDLDDLPTREFDPNPPARVRSTMPERIGPYRMLSRIGEGGMGEVWLAQQETPRRQVALKLVKRGMDTRKVVARFETERQALAVMDHPAIAKVFAAGETESGRPYFVMEYVKGEPITDYCDRNRLTTHQRLELFIEVCRGVQHAHQKAVIHRDLKPSNILVTLQDDRPAPKIIDFGIAKATDLHMTERTLFTELGQMVGTPEYMAPEQADSGGLDIDTRADIYALGVVLYELLAGALPFDARELRQAGLAEIQRTLREVEPPRPSTRISGLGDTKTRIAALRKTEARALIKRVRGDLDWITMKALEKERTRRYETANALVRDIQRHLANEPVSARPPSLSYRASKFVRRNRTATAATALVLLSIVAGASVAVWQAVEARSAERRAQELALRADRQALTANRVTRFLLSLFESADPYRDSGQATIAEMLDRGLESIDDLESEPLVQADLLWTLGEAQMSVGKAKEGRRLLDRSLALRERHQAEDDSELAYYRFLRTDRQPDALDEHYRSLARAAEQALEGRADVTSRERRARLLLALGAAAWQLDGDYDEMEMLDKQALEILETLEAETGQRFDDTPEAIMLLGVSATLRSDLSSAEDYYRQAVGYTEKTWGPTHVRYAQVLGQLSTVLRDAGKLELAEQAATTALDVRVKALGFDHENVAYDLGVLVSIYRARVDLKRAQEYAQRTLELARRIESEDLASDLCVLAEVLVAREDFAAAAVLLEEANGLAGQKELSCRLAEGFFELKNGETDRGDALLVGAFEELEVQDPVNYRVAMIARDAEAQYRSLGRAEDADRWRARVP